MQSLLQSHIFHAISSVILLVSLQASNVSHMVVAFQGILVLQEWKSTL